MKTLSKLLLLLPLLGGLVSLNAQNVGIGTAAPSEKLHVVGDVRITGLSGTGNRLVQSNATGVLSNIADGTAGQVLTTNGAGVLSWTNTASAAWDLLGNAGTTPATNFLGTTDAQDLVFRTNNSENVRINISGNVGIGSTSDVARLYVNTPNTDIATNYGIYNYFDGEDAGTTYGLYTRNYGGTNSTKYGIYNYTNNEGTGARYGVYNNVQQNSASNSPAYGLWNYVSTYGASTHYGVYNYVLTNAASSTGTVYGSYNYISANGTGTHYGLYSNVPGGTNDYAAVFYAGNVVANEIGGDYDFRIEGDTDPNNFFVDASTNNIGIGQGTPVEKLHINATRMLIQNGSDAIYSSYNTGGFRFELIGSYPGWDTRAIYLGGYNVNNTNAGPYDDANKIYCGGSFGSLPIYATGFVNVSSGKLKQNISPSSYGLAEIMKIKPVKYQYTFDKSGVYQLGFIAEEMAEIVPELVAFHDEENNIATEGEAKGIDYSKMAAVLVKAVQEQQEMIATQNELLKKLEAENIEFRRELEVLKNKK